MGLPTGMQSRTSFFLFLSSPGLQPTERHRPLLWICCCLYIAFFQDRVSLYIPGCPETLYIDQAGLELKDLPTSASLSTGIKGLCHCTLLIPPTSRIQLSASNDQLKKSLWKECPEVYVIPHPIKLIQKT